MVTAIHMDNLYAEIVEYAESEPELIPVFLDVGIGQHRAPSKKIPFFRVGEIRVPETVLKEDLRDCVFPANINIVVIAFIPKNKASTELLNVVEKGNK